MNGQLIWNLKCNSWWDSKVDVEVSVDPVDMLQLVVSGLATVGAAIPTDTLMDQYWHLKNCC